MVEAMYRQAEGEFWYNWTAKHLQSGQINYLFLGSSRVAAAVDIGTFLARVDCASGKQSTASNQGEGYSTMAEHYFGLRKLLMNHPDCLKGSTVFIEAPKGIPSYDTWTDDWVDKLQPGLLSPFVGAPELLRYWMVSHAPLKDKCCVALGEISAFAMKVPQLRASMFARGEAALKNLLSGAPLKNSTDARGLAVDLSSQGGIRTDEQGVMKTRAFVREWTAVLLKDQKPVACFDESVVKDIVNMVGEHGGHVVFFEPPMSSVDASPWVTEIRRADAKAFQVKALSWGASVIKPDFQAPDNDFPDLLHLRKSRAGQYSEALAGAYLLWLKKTPPRSAVER